MFSWFIWCISPWCIWLYDIWHHDNLKDSLFLYLWGSFSVSLYRNLLPFFKFSGPNHHKLPSTISSIDIPWDSKSAGFSFVYMTSESVTFSSQSIPSLQVSCINSFDLMVNGANNPNGSNNVDIFSKKFLFVQLKSSSTLLDKNVNVSSSAIQTIPSVFVDGRMLSLISMVLGLSSVVFDPTVFLSLTTTYEVSYHITSIIFSGTLTDMLHCLQFL